jgi:hypothetical protein
MFHQIKKRREHQGLGIKLPALVRCRYLLSEGFEEFVVERALDDHGGSHFAVVEII